MCLESCTRLHSASSVDGAHASSHNEGVNAAACQNHPHREALGVCVVCRAQICSECVTKVDGINHCVSCYAALASTAAKKPARASSPAVAWLSGLVLFTVGVGLVWVMLEAAMPGGG